jgi:hypothetical protein
MNLRLEWLVKLPMKHLMALASQNKIDGGNKLPRDKLIAAIASIDGPLEHEKR